MVTKYKKELEDFFKNYKESEECVITSDGQIFEKKAEIWAKRHADDNGLKLETIQNSDLSEKKKVDPSKEDPKASATEASKETSDVSEIEAPNLKRMNKSQLIEFAKENEITIDEEATNPVIAETIQTFLDTPFNPDNLNAGEEGEEDSEDADADDSDEHKPTNS